MDIHFKHIIPEPLRNTPLLNSSEIWNSDIQFSSEEKIMVHAPSGTGKSTFLNIIFGIRHDFTGELKFSGNEHLLWDELRKQNLSMVHQGLELFDELTALENVYMKNELSTHKTAEEIEQMFECLGISSLKNKICQKLSFGQKQRVAIIRALCQPFNWILLDEPFSHLDKENATTALDLISKEAEIQSAGILLTSLDSIQHASFTKLMRL